jgi:histidinol-phosphate aminotransferase
LKTRETVSEQTSVPRPPAHIEGLKPYQPGRSIEEIREETGLSTIHKLASNENPLGPSPKALEFAKRSMDGVALYPRAGLALRDALATHLGVKIHQVIPGAGSEGVLLHAMRTFMQPGDEAITAEGTFIGFYVLAASMNLNLVTVPLDNDYTYDLDALLDAISPKTRLIYIANPNNPTGTAVSNSRLRDFLAQIPPRVLVIVDEAYYEYAHADWEEYPDTISMAHPQVLTLRTFSKAYGLAGMRIGYGVAHEEVATSILKVKLPFEPSAVSEAAALGALEDDEFLQKSLAANRAGRAALHATLRKLGLLHTSTVANFTLIPLESAERAQWLSDELLKHGIIARPMVPFRLPHTVRITFGNEVQTKALIAALGEIFS